MTRSKPAPKRFTVPKLLVVTLLGCNPAPTASQCLATFSSGMNFDCTCCQSEDGGNPCGASCGPVEGEGSNQCSCIV
jgi:hypothetical protein